MPVLWLIPCLANMFGSYKKQLSTFSCASLVPLGMKWACICAGKENVLGVVWCDCAVCVFVRVAMQCVVVVVLLVASMLASMRWLLCGDKMKFRTPARLSQVARCFQTL